MDARDGVEVVHKRPAIYRVYDCDFISIPPNVPPHWARAIWPEESDKAAIDTLIPSFGKEKSVALRAYSAWVAKFIGTRLQLGSPG